MTTELFREDSYLKSCDATVVSVDVMGICLDQTVFYPMGGGQLGDSGILQTAAGNTIQIVDTQKNDDGSIYHVPAPDQPSCAVGDKVTASIDWERRYCHMRMHSCMHLLCSLVDAGVTGGQISAERGRLDFDMQDSLDKEQLTTDLNRLITENHAMRLRWITDEELEQQPDLVRTMSVKPPMGTGKVRLVEFDQVDLQPCGGTHVAATGEIGAVKVAKIEKKGKHNRRVSVVFAV